MAFDSFTFKLDGRTSSDTTCHYRTYHTRFTKDRFQRTLIRLSPASLKEFIPLSSCGRPKVSSCISVVSGESWFSVSVLEYKTSCREFQLVKLPTGYRENRQRCLAFRVHMWVTKWILNHVLNLKNLPETRSCDVNLGNHGDKKKWPEQDTQQLQAN